MSKKLLSLLVIAIFMNAMFLAGNTARAQEGMMHRCMKGEKHQAGMECCRMMECEHREGHEFFLGMKDKLGLSKEQVSKLSALKNESKKQTIRIKADLEILRIELQDLLHQDKVDVKAVDGKIEKMGELQTKMHKAHVHAKLDAKSILTPEQLMKHHEMKGKKKH